MYHINYLVLIKIITKINHNYFEIKIKHIDNLINLEGHVTKYILLANTITYVY